jgi:RNA polymerase sigma factor (sigma-70 family)
MRTEEGSVTPDDLTSLTDPQLVEQCLAGNSRAWEQLIARYNRLIYSIPLQAGMSRADAAEVFQLVCIKLLRKLSTLRDQQRLAKWLVTTTSRESWRLARSRRMDSARNVSTEPDGGYDLNDIAGSLPLPDEQQLALEKQQILHEAIKELPDKCRDLITLLFLRQDEPTYEEISAKMGMPESSIGPTRARCLEKLRRSLEGKI